MIDVEELKLQFYYDLDSGVFIRKAYRDKYGNLNSCDYEVKGVNKQRGYKRVSINGNRYLLHKLAILYVDGVYPIDEVDHIDGNPENNKYVNLRHVGRSENRKNLKLYKNNKSGFTGVCEKDGKYFAQAQFNNQTYFRGYFDTIEEAICARIKLNEELSFHYNHGELR